MARASHTEPRQCGEGIASCWKLDGKQGLKCQEREGLAPGQLPRHRGRLCSVLPSHCQLLWEPGRHQSPACPQHPSSAHLHLRARVGRTCSMCQCKSERISWDKFNSLHWGRDQTPRAFSFLGSGVQLKLLKSASTKSWCLKILRIVAAGLFLPAVEYFYSNS